MNMAETPQSDNFSDLSIDPTFNDPARMLERRRHALELARQVFEADPSASNKALIDALELDIAEHTPLDRPLYPPDVI